MSYRIIATIEDRPWWGLGLVKREETVVVASPPETTREQAEEARQMLLSADGCLGARLEEVDRAAYEPP